MRTRSVIAASIVTAAACARGGGAPPMPMPMPTTTTAATRPVPRRTCTADLLREVENTSTIRDCRTSEDECRAACERDDVSSCSGLARVVQEREIAASQDHDPTTYEESQAVFRKACLLGSANSCTNHGAYIWISSNDPVDVACAQRLFTLACDHDEPWGCGMQGRVDLERPQRTDEDVARGRAVLERSCAQLRGFPCEMLAYHYQQGTFGDVPQGRIEELMQQACAGGVPDACAAPQPAREASAP